MKMWKNKLKERWFLLWLLTWMMCPSEFLSSGPTHSSINTPRVKFLLTIATRCSKGMLLELNANNDNKLSRRPFCMRGKMLNPPERPSACLSVTSILSHSFEARGLKFGRNNPLMNGSKSTEQNFFDHGWLSINKPVLFETPWCATARQMLVLGPNSLFIQFYHIKRHYTWTRRKGVADSNT